MCIFLQSQSYTDRAISMNSIKLSTVLAVRLIKKLSSGLKWPSYQQRWSDLYFLGVGDLMFFRIHSESSVTCFSIVEWVLDWIIQGLGRTWREGMALRF